MRKITVKKIHDALLSKSKDKYESLRNRCIKTEGYDAFREKQKKAFMRFNKRA